MGAGLQRAATAARNTQLVAVTKSASISDCGQYRYRLTRYWGPGYMLPFVMLNPSIADASLDDPTIRRCMGFARREGAGGIIVVNLYAFRATSPGDLMRAGKPPGPDNKTALVHIAQESIATDMPIVCAWGAGGGAMSLAVVDLLSQFRPRLLCLGFTKDGSPRHPLYVKGDQPLVPFP
jgi:hypothetical protein